MRIESFAQVQQLYQATKPQRANKAEAGSKSDKLHISSAGHDYQVAKKAVEAAPDIREELTASIKNRINSGTYSVDVGSFAEKLLAKYEEMK